jgi:hypothetical protein
MEYKAHTQLKPELVGKLVKVQVFRRNKDEPGQIIHESLETYVGTLRGYSTSKRGVRISLQYVGDISVTDDRQYLEVFDHSNERTI